MPISPNQGSSSGGTTVTITGVNLAGASAVKFGDTSADLLANTPTSITVSSPPGVGYVGVTVVTKGGISNSLPFYYLKSPIIETLSLYSGPIAGGSTVTIYGYNLATASSVVFGSNSSTPTIINDNQISATIPAGEDPGSVNLYVTTSGGTSQSLNFTYVDAPTYDSISPFAGPTTGGTIVTITGTNLTTTSSVTFGGTPVTFTVVSNTKVVVISSAGAAGLVDVAVTTTGGSATGTEVYEYVEDPELSVPDP